MHLSGSARARRRLFLALLALALADARAQLYSVRDLGATDGAESRPFGINNSGQVAALNRTGGQYRAFLYTQGGWSNLGTLGGTYSKANGISDAGHVTGISTNASGQRCGFLWTPGGTNGVPGNPQMQEIGTLGGLVSEGIAVNASGQVAGMAATTNREHAVRYHDGSFTHIGGLIQTNMGMPWSYGYAISEGGDVAGEAYNLNFTRAIAFVYLDGTVTNIGHLGNSNATAFAINSNRQAAGFASLTNGLDRAFRWSGGVMEDLGTLGGIVSYGYAINNKGHIVGASTIDATYTNSRAFIAFSNTMSDLNTLLDDSGSNWVLFEARGINDGGQIVGLGRRVTSIRMFLLNPHPVITGAAREGTNVVVRFQSVNASTYAVDTSMDITGGAWAAGSSIVTGNGGIASATNSAGADASFHRVRLITQ